MQKPPSIASDESYSHKYIQPQLLRAVESDDVALLRDIITKARDSGKIDDNILSVALMRSCERGKINASECLLHLGANPDGTTNTTRTRLSPLLRAVVKNHIGVVQLLLTNGATPNAQDKTGRTALMRAALEDHYHILELLLKHGADPNRKDNEGRNVLHVLASEKHQTNYTSDLIARLLEIQNIAIDGRDELKRTPLHWACSTGKLHLAEMFLRGRKNTRANVNAVENRGKTSLHLAAVHDRVNIVEMLLKYGAAVHMKSDGGWAPLHFACEIGSVEIVDLLLACGAEVNAKLVNGMSPLHLAAQGGHFAVVKSLLQQRRIKKTAQDIFGRTPFLVAAQNRSKDVVALLAPWNDTQGLSKNDTLGACKSFTATIVDFGSFHNENRVQRKTIYELLYSGKPTIIQDPQATFRWIHLPANNMAWADALFKKWFVEDGKFDVEAFGFLERSLSKQYGEQRPHSQHKPALCQSFLRENSSHGIPEDEITVVYEQESIPPIVTLSSTGEQPTSKGGQSPKVGTDPPPRPQANPGKIGSPNIRRPQEIMLDRQAREKKRQEDAEREELERTHAEDQTSAEALRRTVGYQRKSNYPHDIKHRQPRPSSRAKGIIFTSMPYLHFETQYHVHEMQRAIKRAQTPPSLSLPLTKPTPVDEMLIHAYLTTKPPSLHVRRLLDPSIYQEIDLQSRDASQVAENHRSEDSPEHTNIDNKVLMVDQLWMWVLGENLIVTAFPQRWKQPRNDPSNVLESIITHINNRHRTRKGPIKSVYDLSVVITTECLGALSRYRIHKEVFHLIDKFESFIYSATDQEVRLSENSKAISAQAHTWLRYHEGSKPLSGFGGQDGSDNNRKAKEESEIDRFTPGPFYANKLLDTRQESDLLTEIKNTRHEMSNIIKVLKGQLPVLSELEKEMIFTSSGSGTEQQRIKRGFRDQAKILEMHIEILGGIDAEAWRIRNSLTDILELKEKHANAFEARFARDQAAESARRTRNVTLFAILFSPLSFVTVFLIRDNMEYLAYLLKGGHSLLLRERSNKYLLGIAFAILVVTSTITLSQLISDIWHIRARRWKNWKQSGETRESENVGGGLGTPRIRPISLTESDDINFIKQIESIPSTPTSSVLMANQKLSMNRRISFDLGDGLPLTEDGFRIDYGEQFGTGVERDMMIRSKLDAEIDNSNKRRNSGAPPRSDEPPNYTETTAGSTSLVDQAHTEVAQDDLLSTQPSVLSPNSTSLQSVSRLSWTCRCGHESYDDFTQMAPTGLQEMINELQSSGFITKATVTTRTFSKTEIILSRLSTLGRYIGSLIPRGRTKQGLPVSETQVQTTISYLHPPRPDCKFLHVCVEKGRYSTRLHHIDVCDKKTDRAIFQTLRKDYKELRRELNSMLYKIRRIDFVEFQVYPKSLVDSIIPDQLPPPPPENADYEYFPAPPRTKPPIGSKFMMHMWHCKEEVPEKDFFSKRFPKKIREPCQFTWDDSQTANLGWGLHIVESLNVALLVWIAFAFTAVAGLVFGISWTVMKDDVSGAYTVASYITALMTLLLMAVMSVITGI